MVRRPFPPGVAEPGHSWTARIGGRSTNQKTIIESPTECPNDPSGLFRLGSPGQGILGQKKPVGKRRRKKVQNSVVTSNRMPKWLERPFPPGVAEPGHFSFPCVNHASRGRCGSTVVEGRWSQKDAPMVWVDSPPLICPGRGVHRGLRVQCLGFRVECTSADCEPAMAANFGL